MRSVKLFAGNGAQLRFLSLCNNIILTNCEIKGAYYAIILTPAFRGTYNPVYKKVSHKVIN